MNAVRPNDSQRTGDDLPGAQLGDLPVFIAEVEHAGIGARLLGWLRTGTGVFSGIITLLAGTLTVIFLLIPSIKPGVATSEFSATLSDARIETDVVLVDYYARLQESPDSGSSPTDLQQRGVVISYTALIKGFKGKECKLTWSVFDAATNKRAQQDWLVSQEGWPVGIFVPEGNTDQGNGEIFVPSPPEPGRYFVRMELNAPDGSRLTTIDSPVFDVSGSAVAPAPIGLPTETDG